MKCSPRMLEVIWAIVSAGITRRRELHADTGSSGADDDDLVGVFGGRDLAVENIVERVDGKCRPAIAPLVELRQHQCAFVCLDAQSADLHRLTGVDLDVTGPEVQALDRRQQGHGRNGVAEVVDQQRFLADSAIDVLDLVQMGDAGGRRANLCNRLLSADRRQAETIERLDRTGGSIRLQRLVRIALRFAQHEHRWHQHITRVLHAGGQHRVGVQHPLGVGDHLGQRGVGATVGRQQILHLPDEAQTTIDLGLDEEHCLDNGLGLGRCQLVNQLGVDIPWPWPAPDIGNTLVVDGDDGDPVGRLTRGAGTAEVIKPAFQGSDKVGRLVQDQHRQHDCQSCKPICAPELRILR